MIDPIANVTIPAGKSLILPITATSLSGNPLTYTVLSSTDGIAVVMHTNNPFWQLTVAQAAPNNAPGAYPTPYRGGLVTVTNLGTMTFMLFPEYAPHTINVFQGLTESGFYNSNTIFHRVISNFVIQGGDPQTNGDGSLVFEYNDEFNPEAIFSGNGQLALANSGKDTDGCQFFVTVGPQRFLDFGYTLFGQLVRGFNVLSNIDSTLVDTNDRPLADEIIQLANYVTNTTDTVLTLTATNIPGLTGNITVIANDGAGGLATNFFTVSTLTDSNSNTKPFIYPNNPMTNLVTAMNGTLTNFITGLGLDGEPLYWFPGFADSASQNAAINSTLNVSNNVYKALTYNVTNQTSQIEVFLVTTQNYVGPVNLYFDISATSDWNLYRQYNLQLPAYDQDFYTFIFGDTPIIGRTNTVPALASVPFTNLLLATFTNGIANSAYTNFTAAINWGDNTTNYGVVTASAAGLKGVLGSHTYAYPGSYPVYVKVQNYIGAATTILSYIQVTNQTAAATNLFTVLVNGQGKITPSYTNAPLLVGQTYSVSAAPAASWVLISWTDATGLVYGTSTNLTFTMTLGLSLTANFQLPTVPTLAVVSPVPGQLITNLYSAPAIVTGTVSNNVTVTNVSYQVNSGGWQTASGTTNWSFNFTPVFGTTNVIQVYALNDFGYYSPTNTLRVKYLAGAVLSATVNGLGTITPNLNGVLLPLGTNYVLTAAAGTGELFTNWTGTYSTNKAVLKFTMKTNVLLTANFLDVQKPVLTITNTPASQTVTNPAFIFGGTATDNMAVTNVLYSFNNAAWTNVQSANGWANWIVPLTLPGGTNTIAAYAVDSSGNRSLTNSVKVVYVVTGPLIINTNGNGTVSPNDNGALLQLGKNYTLTATAASGWVFYNWTGANSAVLTNKATLTFTMSSGLVLAANFYQPPAIQTQPVSTVAFTGGDATFAVTATGSAPLAYQWQHTSANLSGQTGSSLALTALASANAGSYRVIVSAFASSVTSSVVTLTLTNPPTSLAGFDSIITPAGQSSFQVSFGTNTFSEFSPSNYDNSGAGSYKYVPSGGLTGLLSLTNLLPPEAVSNGTQTVPVTLVSPGLAVFTNGNSTGTIQYYAATNLLPAVWKTNSLILIAPDQQITVSLTTTNAFSAVLTNGNSTASGNYTASVYSPVAAWLQLNATSGYTNYLQLQFTTRTNGQYIMESYDQSATPSKELQGNFTWK